MGSVGRHGRVFRMSVSGVRGFNSGGNLNRGSHYGLFASNLNNAPSNANWNYGASQSYGGANAESLRSRFAPCKKQDVPVSLNVSPFPREETRKIGREKQGLVRPQGPNVPEPIGNGRLVLGRRAA